MNSEVKKLDTTMSPADKALKKWQGNLPLNRAARRKQLNKYKYYLKLEYQYAVDTSETSDKIVTSNTYGVMGNGMGDISSWTVYGVKKDGTKFMIDTLGHYKTRPLKRKEDKKVITAPLANNVEPETNIDGEATISPSIPTIKPIEDSHLILPSQTESESV